MKNCVLLLLTFVLFTSCLNKEKTNVSSKKNTCTKDTSDSKKFEMYQMSEMASLMEQMYAYNQQLRIKIIKGDSLGKFPDFFNKIFTSSFTTPSDKDAFFIENAQKYIATQKLIYSDTKNTKVNFNKGVDACVSCHQGTCGGPIPRIKKLYIK